MIVIFVLFIVFKGLLLSMHSTVYARGRFCLLNGLKKLSTDSFQGINKAELVSRRTNFAKKVAKLAPYESCNSSNHLVIIPAGELQYQSLHVPCHPFRQDSYFRYLTGILEPGAVLALEVSATNISSAVDDSITFVERLFVEERNAHDNLWDGPTLGAAAAAQATGIRETLSLNLLPQYLSSTLSQFGSSDTNLIWFGPPFVIRNQMKMPVNRTIINLMSDKIDECIVDSRQLYDPTPILDELRLIKSPSEVALLRRSADITAISLMKTMAYAFAGIREAELAARLEFEVRMMSGKLGYPAVVAGGPRANIIHYLANAGVVKDGHLVLMDVGAEIEGYTADISRTWPVNGK